MNELIEEQTQRELRAAKHARDVRPAAGAFRVEAFRLYFEEWTPGDELRKRVLQHVVNERQRQMELFHQGKHTFTCSSRIVDDNRKLRVLVKEVGEVAEALDRVESHKGGNSQPHEDLRDELIQVAAVCVAWLESLEAA